MKKDQTLLEVRNLSKAFYSRHGINVAVDSVSFKVARGEVLGLIGQSGSGKTTVANALVRLLKDVTGVVTLNGKVISGRLYGKRKKQYHRSVQKIFQDPHTALNDKRNVFSTIVEPLKAHRMGYRWAVEYIINDKLILQTFRFTLREAFLNAEADLVTLTNELRAKAIAEATQNLLSFKPGKLDTEEERENALSELIASYFDPLLNAENRILARQAKAYNELIAVYTEANEKIKARNLTWDEIDLVNAKEALSQYVNLFDDKKILQNTRQLKRKFKAEGRSAKRETSELLRALITERAQKNKLTRITANLATTNEARAKILSVRERQKLELKSFKALRKAHLSVGNEAVFALEAALPNVKQEELVTFFESQRQSFEVSSEAARQARLATYEAARNEALSRHGEAVKPDQTKVEELTAKVVAAQSVFQQEAIKAESVFNKRANELTAIINQAKAQNNAELIKNEHAAAKKAFEAHFKSLMQTVSDRADKATKKQQLKNKRSRYAAHMYEQKQIKRKIKMVEQLFGMKKVPLLYKGYITRKLLLDRAVMNALAQVGLKPEHAYRYPHEFSGGQKQRINIARALILEPELIIADEPIASLDVSIQAQIINLLIELVKKRNIAMIFIGHDLSIIKYLADSLCVMHLGKIVERGHAELIFNHPVHPYTQTLLAVIPKISNANEPFSAPQETRQYLAEYAQSAPRTQLVESDHLVLANDAQVTKWWAAANAPVATEKVAVTKKPDAPRLSASASQQQVTSKAARKNASAKTTHARSMTLQSMRTKLAGITKVTKKPLLKEAAKRALNVVNSKLKREAKVDEAKVAKAPKPKAVKTKQAKNAKPKKASSKTRGPK